MIDHPTGSERDCADGKSAPECSTGAPTSSTILQVSYAHVPAALHAPHPHFISIIGPICIIVA